MTCSDRKSVFNLGKTLMTSIAERGQFPHVLVIEDNPGDAVLIKLAFKKARLPGKTTIAGTGEIGLAILRGDGEYAKVRHPDIILLDLNLPQMHGLTFLKFVKSDPKTALIPVIVLSSSSAESDVIASYAGQASGFITKPISLDDYDEIVASISSYWFKLVQTPTTYDTSGDPQPARTGTSG